MAKIIGYQQMSGTSKKTGNPYSGFMVYYTEPMRVRSGFFGGGDSCDSAFISDDLLQGIVPEVGADLDLRYDKRGYLREVNIA